MTASRRRWFQFSLAKMFVAVTLLAIPLGWVAYSLDWNNRGTRRILRVLNEPAHLQFVEADFTDVLEYIKVTHQIEVQCVSGAFPEPDAEGVTCEIQNVPLKAALEQILKPRKLTYTVVDGVLLITTEVPQPDPMPQILCPLKISR